MFSIKSSGNFNNTERFLRKMRSNSFRTILENAAKSGVDQLAAATPSDSGVTAASWGYVINRRKDSFSIDWTNSNVVDGFPVAIGIQYGHGTGSGGYVSGQDYINPVLAPIVEGILNDVWQEVISA